METRVYNDLAIYGSVVFAKDLAEFPAVPRAGEIVVMDGRHYAYTKISPTFSTWLPISNKQTAYVHSQGVASTTWTIMHNLSTTDYGLFVYDSDHNLIMVSHEPTDENTVTVTLSEAITGTAVLFAVTDFSSSAISTSSMQIGDVTLTGTGGLLYVSGNQVVLQASLDAEITARANADASLASAIGAAGGTTVSVTSTNTNGTFYPALVSAVGSGITLYADNSTTPFTYNPSTGTLTVAGSEQVSSLGVGTAASGTAGEIRATNNITAYYSSDSRLKENVVAIDNAVSKVNQIRGVYFDWTDDYISRSGGADGYFIRKHDVGIIAQEVEAVLPEIVAERGDGYKAVRYEKIVALLIEAVKELSAEVERLKAK